MEMQATEAIEKLQALSGTDEELDQLEAIARPLRLTDLITVGSKVTEHTTGWGDGVNTACALSAAEIGYQYLMDK